MTRAFSLTLALALAAAFPAGAEPATPEGAERLAGVFQTYLGNHEGLVTVTPSGEAYEVTLDPSQLMSGLSAQGGSGTVTPMTLMLSDMGGGKWNVTQDGPLAVALDVPGMIKLDLRAENQTWSGVFDETLKAFETSQGTLTGLSLTEVVTQKDQPEMNVSYTIDQMTVASSATAGAAGGVDGTMQYVVSGLDETFTLPPSPQMPGPMDVNVKVESYAADGKVAALRTAELLELWAWFVAHPDEAAVKADFGAMKERIRAALPFFDSLAMNGVLSNLTGATPFGAFAAESGSVVVDVNGVKADGRIHEKIALSGLALPTDLMPIWVPPLLPDALTIDFTADSFNLAAPAQILIDEMKPDEKLSPEVNAQLLQAFLPDGSVNLMLSPSGFSSDMYDVSVEGNMTAGPAMPMPVGSALVKVTGLDAVMAALQSAPPEVSQQAIPGIMMARGLAKTEGDDSYSWAIEMGADGKISVNGMDMSAMGGGAQ